MLKKMLSGRRSGIGAVVVALLIMGAVYGFAATRNVLAAEKGHTPPPIPAEKTAALEQMQEGFEAVAQRLEPSVVMIKVVKKVQAVNTFPDFGNMFPGFPGFPDQQQPQQPQTFNERAAGSGIVVRSDGWILTNDHVVSGADKVTVIFKDGRQMNGTVRRDFRSDLALVKVNATDLTPAELGDSNNVKVGQWAIAFGAPYELSNTMTMGVISALHRQTSIAEGDEGRYYPSLIQTDAAINPGNSGGPLCDIHGRVIGINVAINSPNGGSVGIGFAIPSNTARYIMDQLMSNGKVVRGYLGIAPAALTPAQRQQYGVPTGGALVEQVSDNTPASRAGLQVEDVVTKINGKPVADDVALRNMIAEMPPGSKVDLTVHRNGKDITLTATLGTMPDQLAGITPPVQQVMSKLGIQVTTVTPDVVKKYNLGNVTSGVVITQVQQGGLADEAGLQPGDVIMRFNEHTINTADQFTQAVGELKSGDTATMVVRRADSRVLVTIQMP
jgi:serine protease Do